MVRQVWTYDSGTPRITGGESSGNKDLIKEGPSAFGSFATFEPGPTGTLSYEHKQPLIAGQTRARDIDRELHQHPDSDRYLLRSETVFDNAADDL